MTLIKINEINIPLYNGFETSNEDIVYSYFRARLNENGYSFKVKRTAFPEIDNILPSFATGTRGRASCDGYIFSGTSFTDFCGFLELETTGHLQTGINQVRHYVSGFRTESLSEQEQINVRNIKCRKIKLIAYDGQSIYLSEYDLDSHEETIIFNNLNVAQNHAEVTQRLFSLFPKKEIIDRELDEKELIDTIARRIRGFEKLQKNKAFMMTVLASIYGSTRERDLFVACNRLQTSQYPADQRLLEKWNNLCQEIPELDNQTRIREIYSETADRLYELSQERGMDLYGFIYEELATKEKKKEQGEYYTPRHTVKPIISSVFSNYLNWTKDELADKLVLDPFCGSGGFLYEYIRYIKSRFQLDPDEISTIAAHSIWGFDKNGIQSADLNMHLIGDGNANLSKVRTSINWKKHFLFKGDDEGKYDVTAIEDDTIIRNKIRDNLADISNFLKVYVSKDFSVSIRELEKHIGTEELVKEAVLSKVRRNNPNIDERHLGNVDLLITNVPYGKVTDATEQIIEAGKKEYGNSLEVNALRECIDFLKPAKLRNGRQIEEGGIGIIIVPDSILENATNKPIRDYLISRCDILGLVSLPEFTFSPYAMEKTYALVIQKLAPEEFDYNREINENTFMYFSVCDGKANSQNRFQTNHIRSVEIKVPINQTRNIVEFIHNDFDPCFESYSMDEYSYISKLERAWNYSTYQNDPEWDQERIEEVWTPNGWKKTSGKKWGYFTIQRIQRENKKRIKNVALETKILEFIEDQEQERRENYFEEGNWEDLITDFKQHVKLTPRQMLILDIITDIQLTFVLDEQELHLYTSEIIDDIDLNIDSTNYLGVREEMISIEDIYDRINEAEVWSEDELINLFKNSFTSDLLEPVPLMEYFDIIQGTQFSKADAYNSPGNIPVYTAATDGPAYFVSDRIHGKVKIQGPSLIWSRKGAKAGTIQIFDDIDDHGQQKYFYISDVSGTIKPKLNYENYDLTFLKFYISGQVKKELQSKSNNAQLNKSKLENLKVFLPDNQADIGELIRRKLI